MIRWFLWLAFVWSVRLGVLLASTWTMSRLISEELGYRMEPKPMLVGAILLVITVRLWMPWSRPKWSD